MCYGGGCGIKVHRVNGTVVKIDGDETNPMNKGKLCAKGNAALVSLYNPNRILQPLMRRNPEKDIGVDPKWETVSWEKAFDVILDKLRYVKASDARKLVIATFDTQSTWLLKPWATSFGTPNVWMASAGFYCGNGEHPMMLMSHGTFLASVDLERCNYCLMIGTGFGHLVQHLPVHEALGMADARARGMKMVVVNPVCTNAASKADEWIPIRPGTDAAFALGVANLLVNEYGHYDKDFLKHYTNAPYLVKTDGHYVRDPASGKPLIWDSRKEKALPFDSDAVEDSALQGSFLVEDASCIPAFQRLREHLHQYSPDYASSITTVPAETIRRVAKEMGEAAAIGRTIEIGGKTLPLRPAAVDYYRGPSAHKHGWWNGFSVHMLNILLGAMDVPGGHLGLDVIGPYWAPKTGPDGFLVAGGEARGAIPYPPRKIKRPESAELLELFPVAVYSRPMFLVNLLEPRFGLPYKPEVLINGRTNFLLTSANPEQVIKGIRNIPLMVSFTYTMNETSEFCDIVIPDTHFLERLDPMINGEYLHAPGMGQWDWTYRLPVSEPPSGIRHWLSILLEWSERLGFLKELYGIVNTKYGLKGDLQLDSSKEYSYEEIVDHVSRAKFGKGLDWFKQNGHVTTGEKRVEEAYPRPYFKGKMPIYLEHLIDTGRELKKFTQEDLKIDWDVSDYQALPDWKPCPAFNETNYDMYLVNYKLPYRTHTTTTENPVLMGLSDKGRGGDFSLHMNAATAAKKGLKDGDTVWVESKDGTKAKAVLRVNELVHEEVVASPGNMGQWTTKEKEKGINTNAFITLTMDRVDTLSGALDSCVKVRVTKAK